MTQPRFVQVDCAQWLWVAAISALVLALVFGFQYQRVWDDHWFASVLNDQFGGSLRAYLSHRYHTWTSRIVIETVLLFVINRIWLWQIGTTLALILLIVLPVWLFADSSRLRTRLLPISAILVAALPASILFETGYVATTVNYLWPLAAGLVAATPAIKYLRGQRVTWLAWAMAALAGVLLGNAEFVAGFLFLLYVATTIWVLVRRPVRLGHYRLGHSRLGHSWLGPGIGAAVFLAMVLFLLHNPGNAARVAAEIKDWFPTYGTLSLADRLQLGFSTALNAVFFQGFLLPLLFFILVAYRLYAQRQNPIWLAVAALPVIGSLIWGFYRPVTAVDEFWFRNQIWGEPTQARIILPTRVKDTLSIYGFATDGSLFGVLVFALLLAMLIAAIVAVIRVVGWNVRSLAILLILGAGFGSKFALAFTPTVWASGDRTNFYLLFAFALSSILLLAWSQNSENGSPSEPRVDAVEITDSQEAAPYDAARAVAPADSPPTGVTPTDVTPTDVPPTFAISDAHSEIVEQVGGGVPEPDIHRGAKSLTLIIPAYNESGSILHLYRRISKVAESEPDYSFELLFIDDGSRDATLSEIKALARTDCRVKYISFARNFGKEAALAAGFANAQGEATIIMDGDGQHPPELIPRMLRLWEQGYDDIYAVRRQVGTENLIKRIARSAYYGFTDLVIGKDFIPRNAGDFRLLDWKCILALRELKEADRNTKAPYSAGWATAKLQLSMTKATRSHGHTKWNRKAIVKLASSGIISFSVAPLRVALWAGFLVSFAAFSYLGVVIVQTVVFGYQPDGYPTIVSLLLFLCGTILITVGIVGEYVGRIFDEVKRRPLYLVKESNAQAE